MSARRRAAPAIDVDRRWVRLCIAGLAVILAFALALILLWRHGRDQDDRLDRTRAQVGHLNGLAASYASAAADGKALAAQIKAACASRALSGSVCASASSVAARPAPTPSPVPSLLPPVVVSPSPADMAQAVSAYCGRSGRCSQPPTAAQVQAAFDAWCAGHSGCRGPAGKDGANGRDGKTGAAGPAGVSVTGASQDAAHHLILAFSDGTAVDVGELPSGPQGPAGADGRDATPQPFSFSYTVHGPLGDKQATTTCTWSATSGYACTTEEE